MIEKVEWDSEFFGRKIGGLTKVPPEKRLKSLIQQAHKKGYKYLLCRLILDKIAEIQVLEKHGFYMTDIGATWEKEISNKNSKFKIQDSKYSVREAIFEDIPMLKSMVKGLFKDSRFYNDSFFTKGEAEKFYRTWIENLICDKKVKTFFVEGGGFVTCKKVSGDKGNIPLIGVIARAQSKGVGSSLMCMALKWFKENRMKTVTVRTQVNNITAMNYYNKMGFNVKYADITMGLILNKELKKKA